MYAIMAAATSSLTLVSEEIKSEEGSCQRSYSWLNTVRSHIHWYKGRLPGFKSEKEVADYPLSSFLNVKLTNDL